MANNFQERKAGNTEMDDEFVNEVSERYIELYEKITAKFSLRLI